jgi:hypothetical protein
LTIRHHAHAFPVSPRTLDVLRGSGAERCQADELAFRADALGRLPLSPRPPIGSACAVDTAIRRFWAHSSPVCWQSGRRWLRPSMP